MTRFLLGHIYGVRFFRIAICALITFGSATVNASPPDFYNVGDEMYFPSIKARDIWTEKAALGTKIDQAFRSLPNSDRAAILNRTFKHYDEAYKKALDREIRKLLGDVGGAGATWSYRTIAKTAQQVAKETAGRVAGATYARMTERYARLMAEKASKKAAIKLGLKGGVALITAGASTLVEAAMEVLDCSEMGDGQIPFSTGLEELPEREKLEIFIALFTENMDQVNDRLSELAGNPFANPPVIGPIERARRLALAHPYHSEYTDNYAILLAEQADLRALRSQLPLDIEEMNRQLSEAESVPYSEREKRAVERFMSQICPEVTLDDGIGLYCDKAGLNVVVGPDGSTCEEMQCGDGMEPQAGECAEVPK